MCVFVCVCLHSARARVCVPQTSRMSHSFSLYFRLDTFESFYPGMLLAVCESMYGVRACVSSLPRQVPLVHAACASSSPRQLPLVHAACASSSPQQLPLVHVSCLAWLVQVQKAQRLLTQAIQTLATITSSLHLGVQDPTVSVVRVAPSWFQRLRAHEHACACVCVCVLCVGVRLP